MALQQSEETKPEASLDLNIFIQDILNIIFDKEKDPCGISSDE